MHDHFSLCYVALNVRTFYYHGGNVITSVVTPFYYVGYYSNTRSRLMYFLGHTFTCYKNINLI